MDTTERLSEARKNTNEARKKILGDWKNTRDFL
jgi:hypothetical protein